MVSRDQDYEIIRSSNISEPQRRIVCVRKTTDSRGKDGAYDEKNFAYFNVPFPWLKVQSTKKKQIDIRFAYETPVITLLLMSFDGETWVKANFPHLANGSFAVCMQSGALTVNWEDPAANVTSYVMSYGGAGTAYWKDCPAFNGLLPYVWGSNVGLGYSLIPFAEAWESASINDILEYVEKKTRDLIPV